MTKTDIFDKLMAYLDLGIALGFYSKEEANGIRLLEEMYFKAEEY